MEGNSRSHQHNKLYPEPPQPGTFLQPAHVSFLCSALKIMNKT